MRCAEFTAAVDVFPLDGPGSLYSPSESDGLEAHLATCPECTSRASVLEAAYGNWTALTEEAAADQPLPDELRERVLAGQPVRPRSRSHLPAWVAAAAGLLVVLSTAHGLATPRSVGSGTPHPLQTACVSCHADSHVDAQLALACVDCHTSEAWVPSPSLLLTQDG